MTMRPAVRRYENVSKIFSHRYRRALANGVIAIELSNEFRRKLWSQIPSHNHTIRVRRDPNDSWIDNSSVFHEATSNLKIEHGWEHLPGNLIHPMVITIH